MPDFTNDWNRPPRYWGTFCSILIAFFFVMNEGYTPAFSANEAGLLPVWDAEKVTILANQGHEPIQFWIEHKQDGERKEIFLHPGETTAISNPQRALAVFEHGTDLVQLPLKQDEIYVFVPENGQWELYGIGPEYGKSVPTSRVQLRPKGVASVTDAIPTLTIPVVVYMDENIPMAVVPWENRVRERIGAASKVLEKTCFVRLEIQGFKSWKSEPKSENLGEMLKDFETKARVTQGTLAIGFTANRNATQVGFELGVARQPFCGQILLREEAPQITEVERLETLLHELGHFLGAVHTSDENSVMRTVMKERHARNINFTITFDPLNALAMNLWVRQFRRGDGMRVRTIHPDILDEMEATYLMIQRIAADQKAAGVQVLDNPNVEMFLKILAKMRELHEARSVVSASIPSTKSVTVVNVEPKQNVKPEIRSEPKSIAVESVAKEPKLSPEVQELQRMMKAMTVTDWKTEETDELELPVRTTQYVMVRTMLALAQDEALRDYNATGKQPGDVRGEKIVRYAAWAAQEIGGTGTADSAEGRVARGAFLLACHVFLEPSGAIGKIPVYGRRFRAIETPEIKVLRQKIVGNNVSVYGRQDHSQHFWLSAALVTQIVPEVVENIGVDKELHDDKPGGSGFDVTDLNADIAGVWFGNRIMRGILSLEDVGRRFEYTRVVPSQIRIPKRLKHPKDNEEIRELVQKLRKAVHELQKNY